VSDECWVMRDELKMEHSPLSGWAGAGGKVIEIWNL